MPRLHTRFQINKANAANTKLIHLVCSSGRDSVSRVTEDGREVIYLKSATLPNNIVMNGILYPEDEVLETYEGLEGTPAPIEHPKSRSGEYISASHPDAQVNGYLVGAYNLNVRHDGARVWLDKKIDVQTALMTDKGKRLLDRIEDLEAGHIQSIHTSTGVFIEAEPAETNAKNFAGYAYSAIARNLVWDHDAILLDSRGAATPEQGVGIGVNSSKVQVQGFEIELQTIYLNSEGLDFSEGHMAEMQRMRQAFSDALNLGDEGWLRDWNDDTVIYETRDGTYAVGYTMDDEGKITIEGDRQKVSEAPMYEVVMNELKAKITNLFKGAFSGNGKQGFAKPNGASDNTDVNQPATNKEDYLMDRETIIALLAEKGIAVNADISDSDLQAKLKEALRGNDDAQVNEGGEKDEAMNKVSEALDKMNKRMDALEAKLKDNAVAANQALIDDLVQADIGLDAEALGGLAANSLKALHTKHCGTTAGLSGAYRSNSDAFAAPEMP